MTKIIIFFVGILFCLSCRTATKDSDMVLSDFPETFRLEAINVELKNNQCDDIYLVDTFLLTLNYFSEDAMMEVYDSRSLSYLGPLIRKGRAEGEFLQTNSYKSNYFIDSDGPHIWITDHQRSLYALVNIPRTLEKGTAVIEKSYPMDEHYYYTLFLNDSLALKTVLTQEKKSSQLYNWDTGKSWEIDIYGEKIKRRNWEYYLHSVRKVPGDSMRLVVNFPYLNMLKITSIYGGQPERVISAYTPRRYPKRFENIAVAKNTYNDIDVTADKIFCLYVNRTDNETFHSTEGVEIHALTLQGEPLYRLLVDEPLRYFAADEKNDKLFGLTADGQCYQYDLSNLVKFL